MKKSNFIFLTLGFVILVCCQIVSSQDIKSDAKQTVQEKCVTYIEKLKLCINSSAVSAKIGKTVILNYSIKNASDEQLLAPDSRLGRFTLKMTDEKGNKIPSIAEIIVEKEKKGEPLAKGESGYIISSLTFSGHGESDFMPREERKSLLALSKFYYFKTKGKYFIKVYRKPLKYLGTKYKEKFLAEIVVIVE